MTNLADLYQGKSLRQVAAATGLSRTTVRNRLREAGVTLRPRGRPDKRPPSAKTEHLRAEILGDLRHFPAGATVEDLADWLGTKHSETLRAMRDLLSTGKVKIVPVEEEGRAS